MNMVFVVHDTHNTGKPNVGSGLCRYRTFARGLPTFLGYYFASPILAMSLFALYKKLSQDHRLMMDSLFQKANNA